MNTKQYHHDNLKEDLIKNGLKLLNEEGYNNFSLRKVAKLCNVSQTAPYRHFKNKDELVSAITCEALNEFQDTLKSAVLKYPDDLKSQICEMGVLYVKFFVENPDYLQLIYLGNDSKYLKKDLSFNDDYNAALEFFLNTVKTYCSKQAVNCTLDIDTVVLSLWGLVHGLAILISRNEYTYKGDYLDIVKKIIWNKCELS